MAASASVHRTDDGACEHSSDGSPTLIEASGAIGERAEAPTQALNDGIRMLRAALPSTIKLVSLIDPVLPVYGDPCS